MDKHNTKGVEEKLYSFFNQKISRKEFIKKSIIAVGTLALAGYGIKKFLPTNSAVLPSDNSLWKWSKEAEFYSIVPQGVQCNLCPHLCILSPESRGICRDRINKNNKLFTLVYGNPCAVHNDPIEKKPLFHFLPGSLTYSIATAGCNLSCKNCQNWEISQSRPEDTQNVDMMPEKAVENALNLGSASISYTYTDPVVFYEYTLDTAKLAHKAGLKNVLVTAGYINEEPLKKLLPYIDGAHIDLKSFRNETYISNSGATLEPVLNTIKILKKEDVWFEIINLIVPSLNDSTEEYQEMMQYLKKNIGTDNPIHLSRFHPAYKLTNLQPTPVDTLNSFRDIALQNGMKYVYIGNVPDTINASKDTLCPQCEKAVIERLGYSIKQNNLTNGVCNFCGYKIPGVWL
jgi:pyruvate formate lyase activating enzyme